MGPALIFAFTAAVCYGVASALQARAARTAPDSGRIDPRLLARMMRQAPFVGGVALDIAGFAFQFLALRGLALYVVQAIQAGNLAVTAVAAIPLLQLRLSTRHWLAIGAVCIGLTMLAVSGGAENPRPLGFEAQVWLLGAAIALTAIGILAGRLTGAIRSATLGLVAGLGFGVTALSIRGLADLAPAHVIASPAAYALALAGITSFLFFTTGLQRGAVTTVTAAVVVGETAPPAILGILLFGDSARPGFGPVAVIGFALSVAGALLLSRFSQPGPVS